MTNRYSYNRRFIIFSAVILCGVINNGYAQTCYVTNTGTDSGASWLQAASFGDALNDPNCTEIWVKQGVYYPTTTLSRTASFIVNREVVVYGGFQGFETQLNDRDFKLYETVLSGDIGVAHDNTDNSYHVISFFGVDDNTVVDGFIIEKGHANALNQGPYQSGGGMMCHGQSAYEICNPTVRNSIFRDNHATANGGAVYNNGYLGQSSPMFVNVTFENNQVEGNGGAMYNDGYTGESSPEFNQVSFINNQAGNYGGAVHNEGFNGISSPQFTNVTFYGNSADSYAGAIINIGDFGVSNPIFNQVTFTQNTAGSSGSAMTNFGMNGESIPVVNNSIFWGNSGSVVEIYNIAAEPIINDSLIDGGCPNDSVCTNILNVNPMLASLADNGGFSPTVIPEINSPVIDAGNNASCTGYDQRGVVRPQGQACDLGAVERLSDLIFKNGFN